MKGKQLNCKKNKQMFIFLIPHLLKCSNIHTSVAYKLNIAHFLTDIATNL